ncbi:MAG: alpha/beta fold hydrolase [Paracoccaceae bacterium]
MPLIRVNQQDDGLALHRSPAPARVALRHAAQGGRGPVIVMVHGFKFRPYAGPDCPHDHIFAMRDGACWKARSWPRGLGFGGGQRDEGLGLAFGWDSMGPIRQVYGRAARAGAVLADAIRAIRSAAPDRPVHAIAHSLGTRVVLQALPHLAPGDIGRIISLNGAEFAGTARAALERGAGPAAEFIAVSGRENAGYELLLERFVAPEQRGDRALGRARLHGPGRVHLRLDRAAQAERLIALGYPLAPERRLVCHWSSYLRGGALGFYAGLMRQADSLPLSLLQPVELPPERAGWTLLPMGWKASS